jgi:hypothetical protein
MGSYAQWRTTVDGTGPRRITWVCGDQPVLIEEIVDHTRTLVAAGELDTVSLTGGTVPDVDVWAATHQYPLDPTAARFVLVRDAAKIKLWDPLRTWLAENRRLPGTHLLFVAGTTDLPAGTGPVATALEAIKAKRTLGLIVKATQPSPDDLHAWLKRRAPALSDYVAAHLLARIGGNLMAAAHVAAKLALFDVTVSTATIDALVEELPADSFADCLLAGDKRQALRQAESMGDDDVLRALGLLDLRLDLLVAVHRGLRHGRRPHEITGVNPYLARRYGDLAKHYEPRRAANLRTVLAVVDTALRSGARIGLLETLVALW